MGEMQEMYGRDENGEYNPFDYDPPDPVCARCGEDIGFDNEGREELICDSNDGESVYIVRVCRACLKKEREAALEKARRRLAVALEGLFDIGEYETRPRRRDGKLYCFYVPSTTRSMLLKRSRGYCERVNSKGEKCGRKFLPRATRHALGGRYFTVHHDIADTVERDGKTYGRLKAFCQSCNSLESIGDDAIPQFDRSPRAAREDWLRNNTSFAPAPLPSPKCRFNFVADYGAYYLSNGDFKGESIKAMTEYKLALQSKAALAEWRRRYPKGVVDASGHYVRPAVNWEKLRKFNHARASPRRARYAGVSRGAASP